MQFEYTREEMISLCDYIKANPDKSIEDWRKYSNKILTETEKEEFSIIDIAEFFIEVKNKKYKFYLLNWTGAGGGWYWNPMKKLIGKMFDKWYEFDTDRCSDWIEGILITTEEGFWKSTEKWSDYKNIPGLKEIILKENGAEILVYCDDKIKDIDDADYAYEQFGIMCCSLSREYCRFRAGAKFDVFIKNAEKLNYKKAITYFEKQ